MKRKDQYIKMFPTSKTANKYGEDYASLRAKFDKIVRKYTLKERKLLKDYLYESMWSTDKDYFKINPFEVFDRFRVEFQRDLSELEILLIPLEDTTIYMEDEDAWLRKVSRLRLECGK